MKKVALTQSKDFLFQFKAVIWFTGDERENTFTIEEQSTISEYLDERGRLLITGQDIGYDLVGNGSESDSAFFHNYLHAKYIADSSHSEISVGVSGDPITDRMSVFFQQSSGAQWCRRSPASGCCPSVWRLSRR